MLYQHPYLDVYFVFYTYVHDNLWKSAALEELVSQDIFLLDAFSIICKYWYTNCIFYSCFPFIFLSETVKPLLLETTFQIW